MLEDTVIHTNTKNNVTAYSEFIKFFRMRRHKLKRSYDSEYLFEAGRLMRIYSWVTKDTALYLPMVIDGYYIRLR